MKKVIFFLLEIYYHFPMKIFLKNRILLESNPDFSDSTKYVYDELVRRKINNNYKIIWFVKNPKEFSDINVKNVKFLKRDGNILYLLRFYRYNFFSKYIVDCNYFIRKYNKNQFRIFIQHGNPLKKVVEYGKDIGHVDYLVSTSQFFNDELLKIYPIKKEQIINVGFPRNDKLFNIKNTNNDSKLKVIIWMPTYRNHKSADNEKLNTNLHFIYGVPCINNETELECINNILKKNNIKLLLKLHPAEDTSKIKNIKLSNIELFDEKKYLKKHENIYDFLPYTDGLITDYSSVYYDYVPLYKKIGLVIPDISEYTKSVELCYNYEDVFRGEYIYTFSQLCDFFENFNKNKVSRKEREKLINMFFDYQDDKSSKRIVDIIENHMEGK